MARYSPLVMQAIWDTYVPRLPNKDGEPGKPDPRVLWVGPFLDGVVAYMPEIIEAAFPRSPKKVNERAHLKSIMNTMLAGDRAGLMNVRNPELQMHRDTWPIPEGHTQVPMLRLGDRVRTTEPGELVNSPQEKVNPETNEMSLTEFVKGRKDIGETKPFVPKIIEDKRFGLHYLLEGDYFEFSFYDRRAQHVMLYFRLRPLGQTSLVTPELSTRTVAW